MLQIQPGQNLSPLSIRDLLDLFPKLSPARLAQIIQTFIIEEKYTPKEPPPYVYTIFSPFDQDIVAIISSVLGYTTNEYIDEIILAFMSIYTPGKPPTIIYDYAKFIADRMHDQFLRMSNERVFKYSSFLYHLFLYFQSDKFPFTLQMLHTKGQPISVIFWTLLIHKYHSPYSYTDLFVHPIMTMLIGSPPPRINLYIKRILQLSKQSKVGDCYLYQNHIEIRIYGYELAPYKLPKYLPMRLFALEYYRQPNSRPKTN